MPAFYHTENCSLVQTTALCKSSPRFNSALVQSKLKLRNVHPRPPPLKSFNPFSGMSLRDVPPAHADGRRLGREPEGVQHTRQEVQDDVHAWRERTESGDPGLRPRGPGHANKAAPCAGVRQVLSRNWAHGDTRIRSLKRDSD